MPYIKREKRAALDPIIDGLAKRLRSINAKKGDLNYTVTRLVVEVLNKNSYASLSDCVGVLRDAADEIQRRLLGPYEDSAATRNGDLECLQSLYNTPLPKPTGHDCCSTSEISPDGCGGNPAPPCDCGCDEGCTDCTCHPKLNAVNEALTDEQIEKIERQRNVER